MTSALRSMTAAAIAVLLAAPIVAQTTPAQTTPAPAPAPCPPAPAFVNPEGVSSKDGKLRAVVMLADADRAVPNGAATAEPCTTTLHLRYFQGWNPDTPSVRAPSKVSAFSPGPTLRAKVGDKVEIMFLNAVDDSKFSYTRVVAGGTPNPAEGCDEAANPAMYPAKDRFPNCFHGSSTANIHFHGTHTNPDGLGDNVLVQVMPDKNVTQKKWAPIFKKIFDNKVIPATWKAMPLEYRLEQEKLVKARGADLLHANHQQIGLGYWPQYIVGAYPNVFEIPTYKPDGSGKYKAGQAPGTHWYHAHKHGSTALHSLNGMAGAFIIEGDYDAHIRKAFNMGDSYDKDFEKIIVFQLVNANQNLLRTGVNFVTAGPGQPLINGQLLPVLTMKAGQIQMWRFVNASAGSAFSGIGPGIIGGDLFSGAVGNGFQLRQTARDGVQFSPANYQRQPFLNGLVPNGASFAGAATNANPGLMLAGGDRADILIKAPEKAGTYTFNSNGGPVFSVTVVAAATTDPVMNFPTTWPEMPAYLQDLPKPKDYPHHVTFGWDAEPGRNKAGGVRLSSDVGNALPPKYTIDNRQFEEFGPLIDQCMPLNGLQEWVLENRTTVGHPFHIHINPFQITKIEAPAISPDGNSFVTNVYDPKDNFVWSDVITIPPGVELANGQFISGKVTIRHTFLDFVGTYVLHCHILAHEDRGMMQLVRVVPEDKFPEQCQQAIPRHH